MFFRESADMEELSKEQCTIVSSLKLREELKKRGHAFVGSFDRDSIGRSGVPDRLKPWWDAVKGDRMPRVALAPHTREGGPIIDFPLPQDTAALWKLLEEGKP